jgi:hypothetical protein
MHIFCLGGVSGTGKTYLRSHNSYLKTLRCIDIASVYQQNPGIDWRSALRVFLEMIRRELEENSQRAIVLEAFFGPVGQQRGPLETLAQVTYAKGATLGYGI